MPAFVDSMEDCADAIIRRVGKDVRLGLPLGLGKPVELVNALYRRAKTDASLQLTILTALTLEKPQPASPLERAFLQPFLDRVFGDCPELDYAADQRAGRLPSNVRVLEFYFRPGSMLDNPPAQRDYISTNYTFAARDVFAQGCNVAAQLVCKRETPAGLRYSLSCNPDTSPELIALLREAERQGRRQVAVVGVVNQNLPYMGNDAEVAPALFDLVVDQPRYSTGLFSTPKLAVTTPDYAIGLHAASLLRDGGTLQVGIGALGDAVVYGATLRHGRSAAFQSLLRDGGVLERHGALIDGCGGTGPFGHGLYGASEMFVDGFMQLHKAGILKRQVYDFWALQQLINEGGCDPQRLTPAVLDGLEALGVRVIRTKDFEILQHHGLFNDATRYDQGYLVAPSGERVIANVADPQARRVIATQCLGPRLRRGYVLHAAFFLGPRDFYTWLRELPEAERLSICMTGVDKINQLDGNPRLYRQQRIHARFVNTGMMATLSGAVVSDGLADGRVVSGVGGQYNFVAMAHQLLTGRSILMIRAVRDKEGDAAGPASNIVFNYGHTTIPRHLRDIVITEYGIADLRGKTDSEVAKALINVADARFQPQLLAQARSAGKIEAGYVIPAAFRENTPERLERWLAPYRRQGLFPAFPFGTDLTPEEITLGKALKRVKSRAAATAKWKLLLKALRAPSAPDSARPFLERLGLTRPASLRDRIARALLLEELARET